MWVGWQIWERVVGRPWVVTMGPGLAVELPPHDPVSSGVLYCGLPDWPEMPFVLDYLRPGDVVVDVGANVGLYSLLAASVDGVHVVAFEPDEGARRQAVANMVRNRVADRVDIRPHAVGRAAGQASLTAGLGPMNHLVTGGAPAIGHRLVDVVALDDAVAGRVALVKIDVEGGEADVLDGAERLLREHRPALVLEANHLAELDRRLEPLGYRWAAYDPASRRLVPGPPPGRGDNGVAVADFAAAAERLARPAPSP